MRLTHLMAVSILLPIAVVSAVEKGPWIIDLDANVTLTQNAYSGSWQGSEKGALSWASKVNFVAERQFVTWFNHRNTLKLAYGQTKTQDKSGSWSEFTKSTDLIDFESLQKFTLGWCVDPFVAIRLISQFTDERDTASEGNLRQRHYGNPIDLFESFGVTRQLVAAAATKWSARLGGSVHQNFDRYRFNGETGHHEGKTVNDAGFEFVTELKTKLRDGLIDYSLLFTLYQALASSIEDDAAVTTSAGVFTWRYPDINWENILSVNLTKYIMINLTVQMIYDRDKHVNAQFKEVLALGLTYKFNNAKKTAPAAK
ncbi:MAG: DUF3078 domain-containing protein [Chitinispirillaceae bacterium]|nr:DUF3078 domain-containing protein [Chitinispirillaceae bacterium]